MQLVLTSASTVHAMLVQECGALHAAETQRAERMRVLLTGVGLLQVMIDRLRNLHCKVLSASNDASSVKYRQARTSVSFSLNEDVT